MIPATRHLLELHTATVILGMTALFAKFIPLPPHTLICVRSLLTAAALGLYIHWSKNSFRLSSRSEAGVVLLLGVLLSIHWVSYFYVLQIAPIAVGVITLFTFPVMTSLMEPLLYRERWDRREIFSTLMILLGIYFIVPDFSLDHQVTWAVAVGLFSAFLFALRNMLTRKYVPQVKSSVLMFYQTLITGISILPFVYPHISSIRGEAWGLLSLLAVVFTAVPHTMISKSLTRIKASTAGIIMSLQPLYATLFAVWLLEEIPTVSIWIGGTLVGCSVIVETYKQGNAGK